MSCPYIVYPFENNYSRKTVARQHITMKSHFSIFTETSGHYHTVAADAEIEYTGICVFILTVQGFGKYVGPPVVGIIGRIFAIGNAVAYNGYGLGRSAVHIDSIYIEPMVLFEGMLKTAMGIGYPLNHIRSGTRPHVYRGLIGGRSIVNGNR